MARKYRSPLSLNFIKVRMIIGVLAMLLPIVVLLGGRVFFDIKIQSSISAYYHTGMQYYMISTLFVIGIFMFFYKGYDRLEAWLAGIAGVAAIITALFPTAPRDFANANPPLIPIIESNLLEESGWVVYKTIHSLSAGVLFAMITIFALFFFTKGDGKPTKKKILRNVVYRICGIVMFIACIIMIASMVVDVHTTGVFWGEFLGLMAFGIAWAVKGELVFLKDATASLTSERFNTLQARHVRGYKDGMGYIMAILALWFTLLLFDAEVGPFSTVLKDDEADKESSSASEAVTTVLNEDAQGDKPLVPAVQILTPNALSDLCYPTDEEIEKLDNALKKEKDEKKKEDIREEAQEENECFKYLVDQRVQTELKFANISNDVEIPLTFDASYSTACKDEETCFSIEGITTIPKNDYLTLVISFPMEKIVGELEIVGGRTISKIPVSVQEYSAVELELIQENEVSKIETLAYSKVESRNTLRMILMVLVWIVLFLILNYQVLPRLWPLIRRHFVIDLKKDEKGEITELWTLFSNQVNALTGSTGFSVNPIPETKINPPETLAAPDSYLKTIFDIVSWIFPSLGYSLRIAKMESNILGPGLSLTIVKNIGKEVIAEKIFWAQTYKILEDEKDNANDLKVYQGLMLPAFFWFSQKVDEMDGFLPQENAWQAKAYYHLGNMIWDSEQDKAINFYSQCVSQDHKNAAAYNALGRICIERGQSKINEILTKEAKRKVNEETKKQAREQAREYYLLANSYLSSAIKELERKASPEPAYFAALYNQVVCWIYMLEMKGQDNKLDFGDLDKNKIIKQCREIKNSAIYVLWHYMKNPKTTLDFSLLHRNCYRLKKYILSLYLKEFLGLTEKIDSTELVADYKELIKQYSEKNKMDIEKFINQNSGKISRKAIADLRNKKPPFFFTEKEKDKLACKFADSITRVNEKRLRRCYQNENNPKCIKDLIKIHIDKIIELTDSELKNQPLNDENAISEFEKRIEDLQRLSDDEIQNLKDIKLAAYVIEFLPSFEFVIQIVNLDRKTENENLTISQIEAWLTEILKNKFEKLPGDAGVVDMDKPVDISSSKGKHFLHCPSRVQYNAACFYSFISEKIKDIDSGNKLLSEPYENLALDHLMMALSVGGGIKKWAKEDRSLKAIWDKPRFKTITASDDKPQEKKSHDRFVYRSTTRRWANQRIGDKDDITTHPTKSEAASIAEETVKNLGGGKLIVFDKNGKAKPKDISPETNSNDKKN